MRRISLIVLTLFILNVSFGQVHFGLKGGLNLANVGDEGPHNAKTKTGFYAGGLMQVDLKNKLLLRPELLYSVKGFRTPSTQSSGKSTISLHYISIPILLGYRATEDLTILAGPEIGVLTSARLKIGGTSINVSDVYKNWDIGANLCIAYNMTPRLGVDLRYSYGFNSLVEVVLTDRNGNVIGIGNIGSNRVFQAGLYYSIPR